MRFPRNPAGRSSGVEFADGFGYGSGSRTQSRVKTPIDLDQAKLERVMKLTSLATRKDAIDFALTEAERSARVRALLKQGFFEGISEEPIVDSRYDVLTLRDAEIPPGP